MRINPFSISKLPQEFCYGVGKLTNTTFVIVSTGVTGWVKGSVSADDSPTQPIYSPLVLMALDMVSAGEDTT